MTTFDDESQNKRLDEIRLQEEEQLVAMLAESKYKLPYIDLSRLGVDNESLRVISEKDARDLKVGPFKLMGKNVFIAVRSPSDELLSMLKERIEEQGFNPSFYMASSRSIEKIWERYKELSLAHNSMVGGIDIDGDILRETGKDIKVIEDIKTLIEKSAVGNPIHKITKMLEIILAGAIAIGASDIHIEPEQDRSRLRLRLDGVLHDIMFFEQNIYHLFNSRIKLMSGMKLSSTTAQDGRFSIIEGKEEISIRTSLIPGAYGESIVMRILDPKSIQIGLETLGIEPFLFSIIEQEIKKPNGMILVTGPTGSGKTTTLYAFLRKIYSPEIKIITIEDPIEYHLKGITQTQTNEERGYTFLEGLKSALRQDPDIVMVGEIRDAETAKTGIEAALTGHMVFSTLHTNNAAGVIPRLIDLDANPKIMVSALSLSIAQRLVRKLCSKCKIEKEISLQEKELLQKIIDSIKQEGKSLENYNIDPEKPIVAYGPKGCEACNMIGYKGRMGIFEAIRTDELIEKIIPENPSEREIKKVAKNQGILSMRQDGVVKIIHGMTSIEEVASVVDLLEE